ncbi:hypothetical protein FS842_005246 [Serendipita sp. 407]|nr:hypothetical protein FS842_005246 [Serendipita sp. 407]
MASFDDSRGTRVIWRDRNKVDSVSSNEHFYGFSDKFGSVIRVRFNVLLPIRYLVVYDPRDIHKLPNGILRNAAYLPWTSYIFREDSIHRTSYQDTSQHILSAEKEHIERWGAMIRTMERHIRPVDEVVHPVTRFMRARDNTHGRTRYIMERQKDTFFWLVSFSDEEGESIASNWAGYPSFGLAMARNWGVPTVLRPTSRLHYQGCPADGGSQMPPCLPSIRAW